MITDREEILVRRAKLEAHMRRADPDRQRPSRILIDSVARAFEGECSERCSSLSALGDPLLPAVFDRP